MNYDFDTSPQSDPDFDAQIEYDIAMQDQAQRVHELEELLAMAESTAANVDRLADSVDRGRTQGWVATILASLFFSILVGGISYVFTMSIHVDSSLYYIIAAVASLNALVAIAFMMVVINRSAYVRRVKRDLMVEVDIQHRLISMIYQQIQRVLHGGEYSPVHRAIVDIRVRRMMR